MTDIKTLTDSVLVAGQITQDDVEGLRAQGVTTVVINRPDAEELGQPTASEVQGWFAEANIAVVENPIVSGQVTPEAVERQGEVLAVASGKTLLYCRSGMRSCMLWALSQRNELGREEILSTAASAGYDLSPLSGMLGD